MRLIGDEYIKHEFREHQRIENPMHIVRIILLLFLILIDGHWLMKDAQQIGFLTEWQMYAQKIEGDAWLGEKLDQAMMDKMSGA